MDATLSLPHYGWNDTIIVTGVPPLWAVVRLIIFNRHSERSAAICPIILTKEVSHSGFNKWKVLKLTFAPMLVNFCSDVNLLSFICKLTFDSMLANIWLKVSLLFWWSMTVLKKDAWVWSKPHVVLVETTAGLEQNHACIWVKPHVVLSEWGVVLSGQTKSL